MNRYKQFLIILSLVPAFAYSQYSITGKVQDAQSNEPLAGAHIILENSYKSAVSSSSGQFSISNLKKGEYSVRVSYMGFESHSEKVSLSNDVVLEISLKPAAIMGSEVIVSAVRATPDMPVTYSTVTRREIDRVNLGQDMPSLLSLSPSVVTTSDAGTGIGYSSLRIRGTDLNRINVTINGIPLNDAESHGVWWVDLPDFASSTESIQIQRGVGTSTNGAAAFGASINIRTDDPEPVPYAELNMAAGSFKTGKLTVRAGTGLIRGNWAFDGRFSKIYSEGYIDRATANLSSFALSGGYFGRNNIIRLMVVNGTEKTYQAWDGVPGYMLDTNRTYNGLGAYYDVNGQLQYYDNQTDNYRQTHYHLNWLQNAGKNWNISYAIHYTRGLGYYEEYRMDQYFSDYGLEDAVIGSDTLSSTDLIRQRYLDNHFYGLTFGVNYKEKDKFNLSIGGAMNYYQGDHYGKVIWSRVARQFDHDYRWYENEGNKTEANLFMKLGYQVTGKINVYGDVQVRQINYRIKGIDNDLRDISQEHAYTFFNPKVGAFYDHSENHKYYLSFGIGNREPNRSTLTDASPSRPAPKAETLYNLEAGYKYSSHVISLAANLFYMYYSNQLVLTGRINDVGDPVMENVEQSYRTGIELALAVRFLENLKWDLNATFSRNRINAFIEYVDNWDEWPEQLQNNIGNTNIAFSPAVVAGSLLTWQPVNGLELSLISKFVGKQYIDNTSSDDRKLDPYFINDLLASYSFNLAPLKSISFSLKVNNLTNAKYETNAWVYRYYSEGGYGKYDGYFPQAGINFMLGVDLKF